MKKTNALELRQSMGKIIKELLRSGEPILVEKGRRPVAVLISLEDFQHRFVDKAADAHRKALIQSIREANIKLPSNKTSLDILRESHP